MSNRRQFIRQTATFGLTSGLLPGFASTTDVQAAPTPNAAEPEISNDVDVLVVVGGTAGHVAAIQAGRAGASVLLVERNSQLGGTMTTGGVGFPGLFDAWGKQVIAGIGWELVKESVELDKGNFPDFAKVPQAHWHNQVFTNQTTTATVASLTMPSPMPSIQWTCTPAMACARSLCLAGRFRPFRCAR